MPTAVIGALRANLGLDTAQYNKGFRQARRTAQRFRRQFVTAIGGLATAAAFRQLGHAVSNSISKLDEIAKTADSIGLTTDALQELRVAADLSGVSSDNLDTALKRFARTASDARNGLSTAVRAFDAVGVSVANAQGRLKPIDQLLAEVADGFVGMTDATQKAATAQELFGRSGTTMVNLLNAGSAGIEKMREEARRLGIVIDESLIRQSVRAKDELTLMNKVIDADLTRALADLGPILVGLAEDLVAVARTSVEGYEGLRLLFGLASRNKTIRIGQIHEELASSRAELAKLDKEFDAFTRGVAPTGLDLGFDNPNAPTDFDINRPDPEAFNAGLEQMATRRAEIVERIQGLNAELAQLSAEPVIAAPKIEIDLSLKGPGGGGGAEDPRKIFADIVKGLGDQANALDLQAALLGKSTRAAAAFRAETEALNEARAAGLELSPEEREQIRLFAEDVGNAAGRYEELTDQMRAARQTQREIGEIGREVFSGLVDDLRRGASAAEALTHVLERVADRMLDIVTNALLFGQNGGGGIFGSLLGGLLGTATAGGGGGGLGFDIGVPIAGSFAGNFAEGGSFTVRGRPGIDRNLVAFNATNGERVDIHRPGALRDQGANVEVIVNAPPGSTVEQDRQQVGDLERLNLYIDRAVAGNIRPGTATHRTLVNTFGLKKQVIKR